MKMKLLFALTLTLTVTSAVTASATEVGDPAPALKVKEWIKGDKISLQEGEGKNIYVLDFWSTWAPACRSTIPQLSDLQKQWENQNIVFVGISDEDPSVVKPFVTAQGDAMTYRVVADDQRQTIQAYMAAYGVNGIPHTFVVNKQGKVIWHGHPMGELKNVLTQLLSSKFDAGAARRTTELGKLSETYLSRAVGEKPSDQLSTMGQKIVKDASANPEALNHFAWMILTEKTMATRDLELAFKAAQTAFDATAGKHPAIVDTYARALFATGKKEEAVAKQKKAVELADPGRMTEQFKKTLAEYEASLQK